MYPREQKHVHTQKHCAWRFTAATLCVTAKKQKYPKCPSTEEWIKTTRGTHSMGYHPAIRRRETLIHTMTGMNLKNTTVNERSRMWKITYSAIYTKYLERVDPQIESGLGMTRDSAKKTTGRHQDQVKGLFWGRWIHSGIRYWWRWHNVVNILKTTKLYNFTMINFMLCDIYLNFKNVQGVKTQRLKGFFFVCLFLFFLGETFL